MRDDRPNYGEPATAGDLMFCLSRQPAGVPGVRPLYTAERRRRMRHRAPLGRNARPSCARQSDRTADNTRGTLVWPFHPLPTGPSSVKGKHARLASNYDAQVCGWIGRMDRTRFTSLQCAVCDIGHRARIRAVAVWRPQRVGGNSGRFRRAEMAFCSMCGHG
jgi:hypothetical protein